MARSRYDRHATWYDEWVAAPGEDLVARSLLGLIGDVRGARLLDLACGQGRIARRLAPDNEVVGVDLSRELLDLAGRRTPAGLVTYLLGDVGRLDWWDGRPFDGVVASMALMDIDDLDGAVRTASTVLRDGGWFAWSIIHPVFPGIGEIRASWPTSASYFDEGWWNTGADGVRGRVGSNHRTLSTYLNTMTRHGFVLEGADEPEWRRSDQDPALPFFLVTRWRRVGR